jgi:hypothetical protein
MNSPVIPRVTPATVVIAAVFGAVMFAAGRFWSLREVREAQRNAGEAERRSIELQRDLDECRNERLLRSLRE